MSLEVTINLADGKDFTAAVPAGHVVRVGGAQREGVKNIGFRPLELMLISLGACSGVSMTHLLWKKRQEVTDFRVNLAGTKSKTIPIVFTNIDMEYVIEGKTISEKAVRHAVELTEKNCSVLAMLKPSVSIVTRFRIVEHPMSEEHERPEGCGDGAELL